MAVLETQRLLLRPFAERDYEDLYELLSQRREEQFEAYPGITYEMAGPICNTGWAAATFSPWN